MKINRAIGWSGACVVIVALGWAWRTPRHGVRETAASSAELDEMKSSMATLHDEVAMNRALLDTRARPSERINEASTGATTESANGPPSTQSPASANSDKRPVQVQMIAQLDDKFANQAIDPDWSKTAATTAAHALSSHLSSKATLSSIECRTELCRAETRHPTLDDYQSFMKSSFLEQDSGLWNGGVTSYVVEQTPNEVVAVSFIAKEGHDIPNTQITN